jgi:hypothetical protein
MSISIITQDDIIRDSYTPRKISRAHNPLIFQDVPSSLKDTARSLMHNGYRICAVSQRRGYCDYNARIITIPVWVINSTDITEKIWYIAHELAHALSFIRNGRSDNHGPLFMQTLKEICPPNCIHHEVSYKPRNARNAGISADPSINDFLPL